MAYLHLHQSWMVGLEEQIDQQLTIGLEAQIVDLTDFALHQKLVPGLEAQIAHVDDFGLGQK